MGIANKSLKSLLSKFKVGIDFTAVIDALSLSFDRLVQFIRNAVKESNAGTASITIEEWYNQLEIHYDPTKTLTSLQARAKQVNTSTGGSSLDYLNEQIHIAYPDVSIEEVSIAPEQQAGYGMAGLMMASDYPAWLTPAPTDGEYPNFYYRVYGAVDTTFDLFGIQNLLDHIMPAPYEPFYNVTIRNLTPTAKAGMGMAGLMMAGRSS